MLCAVRVGFLGVVVTLLGMLPLEAEEPKAKPRFVPPKGACLLMVGQDHDHIVEHARQLKIEPAGVMAYTSIQRLEGLTMRHDAGGAITDCQSLLENFPHSTLQLGLYLVGALEDLSTGKYDGNVDKLGDWLKATKRPVFLRVGYEFDFPANKYAPKSYVTAFRRIRERIENRGATNVAYVWHSYAGTAATSAADWYPGDAYVDWVAVSFFSTKQPHLETIAKYARYKGKPLMVAEATPRGLGTNKGLESWNGWFVPLFQFAAKYEVRAICYIDRNWEAVPRFANQGWGDTRIATNTPIKDKWLLEIGKPRYLKGTEKLYTQLGFTLPSD